MTNRDLTPGAIRAAEFRSVLRGFDRLEVAEFLDRVAVLVERLDTERGKLETQLKEGKGRDLESEFDSVGVEVTSILQAAREAADSMGERATVDAARWRSEAMSESETNRKEAAADAEALRRDAWTAGTELLQSSMAEAKHMREQAERDVLSIMGESEREAHRLTSGARREAEDMLRGATMDAEKMSSEATKRRDEIIDAAHRQAASAQERARALEQRKDELLEELESVRSTLIQLEGSLEERRDALEYSSSESTSVRVVPSPSEEETKTWELGETVRIVPPPERAPAEVFDPEAEDEAEPEIDRPEPEPEPEPEPAVEIEEMSAPRQEQRAKETAGRDDVSALFASLRGGEDADEAVDPGSGEERTERDEEGHDWIEERDLRLLPITNRALRGTKKAITELQNVALDALRNEETWRPDAKGMVEAVRADLIGLWGESYAAGHAVAEAMTHTKLKRPKTPTSDAPTEFANSLATAVGSALDEAGGSQRERLAAASRVFRVWRSDEAERRIREMSIHAYQRGVEQSAAVEASS